MERKQTPCFRRESWMTEQKHPCIFNEYMGACVEDGRVQRCITVTAKEVGLSAFDEEMQNSKNRLLRNNSRLFLESAL